MKNLIKRKPLLLKILAIVLLVILCCKLPGEIVFWVSCLKEDRDIPPNAEVIVSGCKSPYAIGVPGGEALFVSEGRSGRMYLLDLRTEEKRRVTSDPLLLDNGIFLNSELVWLEGRRWSSEKSTEYVLDVNTGKRYELLNLGLLPRLQGGKFDPKNYDYFQSAQYIFLEHHKNVIIALSSDFRTNPNGRVFLYGVSVGADRGDFFEPLMEELGVKYEIADLNSGYADIYSPLGKYFVRNDVIYRSDTGAVVMDRSGFLSWYYDDSGVVQGNGLNCVFPAPEGCLYWIGSNPLVKLYITAP